MRPILLLLLGLSSLACSAPERPDALEASPLPMSGPVVPSRPEAGVPTRIPLAVRETAGVARSEEVVRSGVPLPRALGVRDPRALGVVGPDGRPVPAEFHVLARWSRAPAPRPSCWWPLPPCPR